MADRILLGDVEPIRIEAINSIGTRLTGSAGSMFVICTRESDGYYLDWSDKTFKSSGWTTLSQSVSESNRSRSPGMYQVSGGLDTGAITNPNTDDFLIFSVALTTTNILRPVATAIRIDGWAADIATGGAPTEAQIVSGVENYQASIHGGGSWEGGGGLTESQVVTGTENYLKSIHGTGAWTTSTLTEAQVVSGTDALLSSVHGAGGWSAAAATDDIVSGVLEANVRTFSVTGSTPNVAGTLIGTFDTSMGNWSIDPTNAILTHSGTDGNLVGQWQLSSDYGVTITGSLNRTRSGTVGN